MQAIVFPNPRMKLREEQFGAIVKTDKGIFLLDRKAYSVLRGADVDRPEGNPLTVDGAVRELLDIHALVQIDKEDAKWVRTKQGTSEAT